MEQDLQGLKGSALYRHGRSAQQGRVAGRCCHYAMLNYNTSDDPKFAKYLLPILAPDDHVAGCIADKLDLLKVTHLNASEFAHRRSFEVGCEVAMWD